MLKKIIKYLFYLLIIIVIGIFYISYYGVETNRFNELIKKKVSISNKNLDIEIKSVKILLNLKNYSFNLKTINPSIIYNKKKLKLNNINTNFSISSFFKKNFSVDDLEITTEEIKINNIVEFIRLYKNSPQLFILQKIIKEGVVVAKINLNFDKNGKIKKDYKINGIIKNGKVKLLNKVSVENLNFNFKIQNKEYFLSKASLNFNKLKFLSELIEIKQQDSFYFAKGDISSNESDIKTELLNILLNNYLNNLSLENINLSSKNKFSFKIDKIFKVHDLNLKSKIKLNKVDYKFSSSLLTKYLPNFDELINLNNHTIDLIYKKKKLTLEGHGKFLINQKSDFIKYKLINYKNNYDFKSTIQFNNNDLIINQLKYKKGVNKNSSLDIEGYFKKNKEILFKNILFLESNNKIYLKDLKLDKNFKIISINKAELNFKNKNKIYLKSDKKNYEIIGDLFDASILVDRMMNTDNDGNISSLLSEFNSTIKVKINKTYLDDINYLNNLNGSVIFKKNKLNSLNLNSNFLDDKQLKLTINTNKDNEKVTTLFFAYPKPLVKRYKFIKGFEEGVLDFYSIKKNNVSKSVLKIDNFKVKEVPVLAKLLTLASLQGIADLLTGEGIRFTDFEMTFSNKDKLMTIDEIYAIGPAISIMMDGYIQSKKLISLRGTLVPATTINRSIASIPLIGNILVGKKVGEGVFGVSFKIKGPPKNLKTTVNPVKTLTPRFITRTLEKIKKN